MTALCKHRNTQIPQSRASAAVCMAGRRSRVTSSSTTETRVIKPSSGDVDEAGASFPTSGLSPKHLAAELPAVRAVRERIDWEQVRKLTADNDFATAFLVLADRLGITH